MQISIIEPVGGHGGNEFYDFGLCENLTLLNHDVSLYTCDETKLDKVYSCNFTVNKNYKNIYGNDHKLIRGYRYIKGTISALFDSLKRKSQIVHFHIYHFSILELFNVFLFKLFRIHCVATIHDVESFDKYGTNSETNVGIKTKLLLFLCDSLIVHSALAENSLIKIGMSKAKVHLVPHGDTDYIYNKNKLSIKEARKKLNLPIEGLLLLFFGQIKAVKGLDVLIKAMPNINQKVNLMVVGKCWKQELADYVHLVKELDIEDKVHFINTYVPNEDVPLYFWSSDFVCLPYKKIYSSGVVLRAMDYGTAVICSDLDPLKGVVKNRQTGILFESENCSDLANKINILVEDEQLRNSLRIKAKAFVDKNYSWSVVAQATESVYKKTLGE